MYLYNITFAADKSIESELAAWLTAELMGTATSGTDALMQRPALMRVVGQGEPGTVSLAVHMYAESTDDIERWYADHGCRLFADAVALWGDRVVFFPTTLEVLV